MHSTRCKTWTSILARALLLGAHVFTEALAGLQKGGSARRMDLGGSGDRVRNIRFCLFGGGEQGIDGARCN